MPEIIIEACAAYEINACDLQAEIVEAERTGARTECYRLTVLDEQGYRKTVTGWLLWFPDDCRAGIAWGADAAWTDAVDAVDAVSRWQSDEMVA